jgi:hypothetical protein
LYSYRSAIVLCSRVPAARVYGRAWGLRATLPSREFAINQAWCTAEAIAADLIAWLQILGLDPELATAEPKRLRYRVLHTAASL